MKKILLFFYLTSVASFIGYTQIHLSLTDSTGSVGNNTEKTFRTVGSGIDISSYMFVINNSDQAMNVMAKRVRISVLDSSDSFCWGLCYDSATDISHLHVVIPPHDTNFYDFSGHYKSYGLVGVTSIRYVFYDETNTNDSVCFIAHYNSFPEAVENQNRNANFIKVYPNPADKVANFSYSIGSFSQASLVIRNLLGTSVKTYALDKSEGNVSLRTSDIEDGIYFYSLIVNGETRSSHKLIIKH
jgi:hypothetical protein